MTCTEFRASYTEYRDGLIAEPGEERRFDEHLAGCASCRRYDATVRRAVLALQAAETVEPSADFRRRLDRRLKRERFLSGPALPARIGLLAAMFVAVACALVALEGVRRPVVYRVPSLPPVPFPKPVAQAGLPFVSFQDPRASVVISNPSPYGTALVEPATARR
ncbi:MAG TPA: zf-HC2 domain-containing protein [Gemmatimonadales bacterium]|nr:zf-HC2 domain-containing protein [Gemmatimonadales bacterium]